MPPAKLHVLRLHLDPLSASGNPGLIRDRAEVRAMCEWAAECDEANTLGQHFDVPAGLSPQMVQTCVKQEGWVLGAK